MKRKRLTRLALKKECKVCGRGHAQHKPCKECNELPSKVKLEIPK